MPLCFAHAPSSAWNVLPLLNLPPLVESSLSFHEQLKCHLFSAGLHTHPIPGGTCRSLHQPTNTHFTLLTLRSFGWFFTHHFGSLNGELLRGTESILLIFVSSVLVPVDIWKFLVVFIQLTEWLWEVLKGLNSYEIWDKQQKTKHKICKKELTYLSR